MVFLRRLSKRLRSTSTSKKRVSFNETADIRQIDMIENRQDVWLTQAEVIDIRLRDLKMTTMLRSMDQQEVESRLGESSRGLEHTGKSEYGRTVRQRQSSSFAEVMSKQRQKVGRETIARVYSQITFFAAQDAIERAKSDEQFVDENVRSSSDDKQAKVHAATRQDTQYRKVLGPYQGSTGMRSLGPHQASRRSLGIMKC